MLFCGSGVFQHYQPEPAGCGVDGFGLDGGIFVDHVSGNIEQLQDQKNFAIFWDAMKNIEVELCKVLPPREELNGILSQYYDLIVHRMRDMGFDIPLAAPQSALSEFWTNSGDYLPPKGCLVVARKSTGEIVGCGMLQRLDQHTGELKRVFVTEDARGTGIGRALIEARENAARGMGLRRLIADTLTPNVEMRNLYPKLGFVELKQPIETTTYNDQPMLRPYLHFFSKDL